MINMSYCSLKLFHRLRRITHRRGLTSNGGDAAKVFYHQLQSRQLISIDGADSSNLLQGLVTNDMNLFQNNTSLKCLYSMMLNSTGRVLYDVLIYSTHQGSNGDSFVVECDHNLAPDLLKHLNVFKMRKKLTIRLRDDLKVWTVFQPPDKNLLLTEDNRHLLTNLGSDDVVKTKSNADLIVGCSDPRLASLGHRLILSGSTTPVHVLHAANNLQLAAEDDYHRLRCRLGIGEGAADHPPDNCFPFECNLDYLNGVSFEKGCYLGQELTARTHYTGVIRKRLLPLILENSSVGEIGDDVFSENEKKVGKIRRRIESIGLALLRLQPCLQPQSYIYVKTLENNSKISVRSHKPFWWPQEIHNQGSS